MCVNNLSNVALDSAATGIEPATSSRKSNTLTTAPPSHTTYTKTWFYISLTFTGHDLRWIKWRSSKNIVCCFTVEALSTWTCQLVPRERKRNNSPQQVQCGSSLPRRSFVDSYLQVQFVDPDIVVGQQLHEPAAIGFTAASRLTCTNILRHSITTKMLQTNLIE